MKRRLKPWQIAAAVIVLVLFWFLVVRGRGPAVPVAKAEVGTALDAVTGSAKVFAFVDMRVKCERPGLLVEAPLEAGARVEAGDIIAVQAADELKMRLEQVSIRLQAARDRLALTNSRTYEVQMAEDDLRSVSAAVSLGQAPRTRLEQAQRERDRRASLLAYDDIGEKEAVDVLAREEAILKLQVEQMTTRAPMAGKIVEKYAWPGAQLGYSSDLVRLVSDGRFVELTLNEEDYAGVQVGQPVSLRLATYPDRVFTGKVSIIDPVANADQKNRKAFVDVSADDETLVPGLTGEGYLIRHERANAVLVPRRALIGNRVWVVRGGTVRIRTVQPGYTSLNQAEILSGVREGEVVVLERQLQLRDGQSVRAEMP